MEKTIIDGAYQVCQIVNNVQEKQLYKYEEIINAYVRMLDEQADHIVQKVVDILKENRKKENVKAYIYLSSVIINITLASEDLITLEKYIVENTGINVGEKFFLFYQIKSLMFCNKSLVTEQTLLLRWQLYRQVMQIYSELINIELSYIPAEKRNHNLVFVVTEQFLITEHGPTKTALDRCRTLITKLNKKVILINTAEFGEFHNRCMFYNCKYGNYIYENLDLKQIEWKNVKIPFVQCDNDMPTIETLDILLKIVYRLKPEYIVMIGGNSIFANLADNIVPVLAVGLSPSAMETTMVSYQTLTRKLDEQDIRVLHEMGKSEDSIIQSVFTSGLKEQTEHITRQQLGIPQDAFVLAVVGARLDVEVTNSFCDMLESVLNEKIVVAFLGEYNEYCKINKEKYPKLKKYSYYLGFCTDILAYLECCDLYVNPIRSGGGTSSVESLYKGVPVVTTEYGDVPTNVGEEFWVKDYEEMKKVIKRYYSDSEFYQKQSEYALQRVKRLLDTDGEFVKIISEMERREQCKA
jgi:hypothetical protein